MKEDSLALAAVIETAGAMMGSTAVLKCLIGGESIREAAVYLRVAGNADACLIRVCELADLAPRQQPKTLEEGRRFLLAVAAEMTRILEAA